MELLDHLAHDGVLAAADARLAGVDGEALARHRRSGRLVRLTRGWYAVRPPRDARDRHALTATALGREYAGRALVSHHSALVLLDLPTYDVDLSIVHLTRLNPRSGSPVPRVAARRDGLVLHQPVAAVVPPEVTAVRGSRRAAYVPPELAVVQAGLSGTALTSLVAADAALYRGLVSIDSLTKAAGSLRATPASGRCAPSSRRPTGGSSHRVRPSPVS